MIELESSVTKALRQLGDALGCELKLNSLGLARLAFRDGLACTIEAPIGAVHVYFHFELGRASADHPQTFKSALQFNLFGLRQPASWLALDPETEELTLCAVSRGACLDAPILASILADLHEDAKRAQDLVLRASRAAAVPQGEDGDAINCIWG